MSPQDREDRTPFRLVARQALVVQDLATAVEGDSVVVALAHLLHDLIVHEPRAMRGSAIRRVDGGLSGTCRPCCSSATSALS